LVPCLQHKSVIIIFLTLAVSAGYATMVSDDAKWRRGMFSEGVMAKTAGRITPDELTTAVKEGKVTASGKIEPTGETTAASALAEGELRFKVDPDYGFIEYRLSNQEVSLYGGAFVEYAQNTIKADVIRYRVDDKVVWAEGRAILTDPQQSVIGRRMSYDLNTKQGLVYGGNSQAAVGYYTGEKVKWVSQKTLFASNGTFTTCDKEEPDYNFWSPRLKITLDEQVVAQPAVMHISRVPVMALPFYYMSLRRDRHSGFLAPYVRYVSGQYFTVNNGYFWAINDFCDLTARLNYYSKRGWQQQGYFVYLYGSRSSINSLNVGHMFDRSVDVEWWSVNWYHRQDITDRTTALGQLALRNDVTYDRKVGEDFQTRTVNNLSSFAALTHRMDAYSFLAEVRRTELINTTYAAGQNPLAAPVPYVTTTSSLPHISLSGTTQEIGDSAVYYSLNSNFMNYYQYDRMAQKEVNLYRRMTATGNLTRPFRFFGWLNYAPAGSYQETWEIHNVRGFNNHHFEQYTLSNGVNTKIYGIFPLPEERVLRHIIYPSITHTYSPQINTTTLYQGYIAGLGSNYLSLSLSNSLDLRLPDEQTDSLTGMTSQTSSYRPNNPTQTQDTSKYSGDSSNSTTQDNSASTVDDSGLVHSQRSKYYGGTRLELVDLSSSISYNFWPYQVSSNRQLAISITDQPLPQLTTRNWSELHHSLKVNPTFANWYNLSSQLILSQDPYKALRTTNLSVVTSLGFNTAGVQKEQTPEDTQTTDGQTTTESSAAQTAAGINRYNPSLENTTLDRLRAGEGMGEGFMIQFDHEYSPGLTSSNDIHTLRGEIGFDLSRMWRIRYDNYYDLHNGRVISEHYRIYRDLHCWEAEVRISTERSQVEYWFQIRIKELPEFQLFGTRQREY
jgi:lipopolysaccharide assembly outer membrane protein LptD (OstA)